MYCTVLQKMNTGWPRLATVYENAEHSFNEIQTRDFSDVLVIDLRSSSCWYILQPNQPLSRGFLSSTFLLVHLAYVFRRASGPPANQPQSLNDPLPYLTMALRGLCPTCCRASWSRCLLSLLVWSNDANHSFNFTCSMFQLIMKRICSCSCALFWRIYYCEKFLFKSQLGSNQLYNYSFYQPHLFRGRGNCSLPLEFQARGRDQPWVITSSPQKHTPF